MRAGDRSRASASRLDRPEGAASSRRLRCFRRVSVACAGRGRGVRRFPRPLPSLRWLRAALGYVVSVSDGFAKKGVDGSGSGPYIGVIDGGAAGERPAGFDASELISGVQRPAGFAGCVVVFPVRRFGAGRTFGGLGCPTLFDNFIGRKRNVDGGVLAARFGEHCAAMRGERHSDDVTFPDSSRSGFRAGADVFGTRREVRPSGRSLNCD